jgi:signal transduction histidine kinase
MTIDYRAYPILFVDDEPQNLVAFRYALDDQFTLLTASSGAEAIRIMEQEDVAIVAADQRMPEMSGVEVCRHARTLRPDAVRIIITAYADLHSAIDAINEGQVSRYLTKPWRNEEMVAVLRTGIEIVHLQQTVRDMEMRLLRGGQNTTALAVQEELAHELSNPLSALAVNGQLVLDLLHAALEAAGGNPRLRELLVNAQETQEDTLIGVDQLRSLLARLRRGHRASSAPSAVTCDAARVIDSTVRILRSELERMARVEISMASSPMVPMDPSALGQVMLNLLLNAAQALEGTPAPERLIRVGMNSDARRTQITVSDTGAGIPKEEHYRIFDPYFTTKTESSGLGLAIVRDLVTQVGGEIDVDSTPGKGATFTVTLPSITE